MPSENFHSATIPQDRLLPGIHGLRGIAALSVVLFHLVHLANIAVPQSFTFIASDFGKGVHLFFILSAFSLMHSTERNMYHKTWVKEYFVKRFFRIAPLYYCIMAGIVLWPAIQYQILSIDFHALLLNLTFTFGLVPWKGIVWGGWSVGVEMLFYAIFPILLMTVWTRPGTLFLVAASIIVTYVARSTLHTHYEFTVSQYQYNWAYFSFAANLCFFAMGMYAFRVTQTIGRQTPAMRWWIPAVSLVILGILLFTELDNTLIHLWKADLIVWGIGFAALAVWQSTWPSRWSANKFMEYLGERSYSVYLLHPVIIVLFKPWIQVLYSTLAPYLGAYAFFVCFALLLIPLLTLSEATYRFIEIPGIQLGRRINRKISYTYAQTNHEKSTT